MFAEVPARVVVGVGDIFRVRVEVGGLFRVRVRVTSSSTYTAPNCPRPISFPRSQFMLYMLYLKNKIQYIDPRGFQMG